MKIIFLLVFQLASAGMYAQKVFTKNGNISFFSKASLENISADNNQVMSIINEATGELIFSVITRSFNFKKSVMEEHFNEDYMEGNKYPRSTFKGTITDLTKVNFTKEGSYAVNVSGDLTIHGASKKISISGMIIVKNGITSANSKFSIKLADYNIKIPSLVKDNISENVEITINCTYDQKI